jgi:hypothetical protein
MIKKILILIFFIIIFIIINFFEIKAEKNKFEILFSDAEKGNSLDIKKITFVINEIFLSQENILEIKITRNNTNLIYMNDFFDFDYVILIPEFEYVIDKKNNNFQNNYSIFNSLKMNVEILWKNRNNLKEFFPENLIFSGMRINVQNEKIGYAYFFDKLIELKINENIGNSKVIDIFENGILLLTEDGNFEVIL